MSAKYQRLEQRPGICVNQTRALKAQFIPEP